MLKCLIEIQNCCSCHEPINVRSWSNLICLYFVNHVSILVLCKQTFTIVSLHFILCPLLKYLSVLFIFKLLPESFMWVACRYKFVVWTPPVTYTASRGCPEVFHLGQSVVYVWLVTEIVWRFTEFWKIISIVFKHRQSVIYIFLFPWL